MNKDKYLHLMPEVCPRCNKPWDATDQFGVGYTSVCGLRFITPVGVFKLHLGSGAVLYWEDDHSCTLYPSRDMLGIILPWLPFTVSKEDIEKYLVLI